MPPPLVDVSASRRRTAWLLVIGQFSLLALVVMLPHGDGWTVPPLVATTADVAAVLGLVLMVVAGLSLGRGLTAAPLPNAHAHLRTGGLYRLVRHPIYSGLLLFALARTVASGNVVTAAACVLLVVLLEVKARWEEGRLRERFPGYDDYARRTPRFVPRPWLALG